ncbi:MAG TPA: GAF domain-containing protein [Chloroflexota bacterium]|jgi:GAF domain-containing protein
MTDLLPGARRPRRADSALRAEQLQLQIDALNELAEAIPSGQPLERVLPGVAAKAASLVGGRDALISLLDEDGILRLALPHCEPDDEAVTFDMGSHAYLVAQDGRPVIVNDLDEAPLSDCDRQVAREHGISGFMAVPLRSAGRLIGLLHISQRIDGRPYVEEDAELIGTFASQAAIAIENARLYAESQAIATRLRALLDAATETVSSLEIDEILQRVCERARDLCDADTAAISLLDDTGTRLLTATMAGYDPADELRVRSLGAISLSRDPLTREAFESGAAVHSWDYLHDPRTLGARQVDADQRSVTAVPLLFRGTPIGLLLVGWRRRHHLRDRERELIETLARQASVAIENARLFGAVSRRTNHFKALVDLAVRAATETDASAVIRAATEAAAKLLAADRASLRLYDEREDLLSPACMIGYGPVIRPEHLVRRPGQGTPGRAFLERRPVIENRYTDPEVADGRPEHVGLQSNLSVPLLARGRAIGVLNVGSMRARQFDNEDSELLQLFANQAALSIDSARLLQRETEQARRLEVLYDTAKMLTSSLDLSDVLDAIIEAVARLTGATFCACYLVDEREGDLCYAAGRGERTDLWRGLRLRIGEGVVGASVRENRPLLISDIRQDARSARSDLDEAEGLRAVIYAPLRARGKVIGALGAGRPEPDSFTEEHLRLLSAFADQASSAIANARLHDRTESDLRHLTSLREVVESISAELDLQPLLDKVVTHAVELLRADGGTVSMVDPKTGGGRLKSVLGLSPDMLEFEIPPGTGLVGRVLKTRQPVLVDEYQELPQPIAHPSLADLHAGVAVPIWRGEALVGVFAAFSRGPGRRFTPADVETLTTFAKHAAIAIANAKLYEKAQEAAVIEERNRLAREIHDTLAQGLTGIILQLELAEMSEGDPAQVRRRITRAIDLARGSLQEARSTIVDLRSEPLDSLSLPQALGRLANETRRDYGLQAEFRGPAAVDRFSARVESALYRIAQEAVANVRRHAGASRVLIELAARDDHLCLSVEDDGQGFDPTAVRAGPDGQSGFGLRGMSERAALLGGELLVESRPGGGTRVEVRVPMTGQVVRVSAGSTRANGNGKRNGNGAH